MEKKAEDLIGFGNHVVIKLPMTDQGLLVGKALFAKNIKTNVTFVFSAMRVRLTVHKNGVREVMSDTAISRDW